ncbi:hypothetical protein BOX15_Mlig021995g1, partial [Macrostomum lignano]
EAAASQPAEELLDPHELTSVPRQSLQRWLAKSLRGQVRCGPPSLSNLAQYPLPYRAIAAHLAATDGKAEWQTDAHNAIVPLGDLCIGLVCDICLACVSTFARPCCAKIYCARCLTAYALETMRQAQTTVGCPNLLCDKIMPQAEVMCRLPSDERWRYQRFLDNSRANGPLRKTCPGCACPTELSAKAWRRPLQVECSSCGLVWCFPCHAPMHRGVTCRQFRASDQELMAWSKRCDAAQGAQRNARQCPGCGAYIQKSQGCDSMTCSQCGTRFCYLCGQRYARCPLLGSHKSRMSVMGCRYNLLPDRPHLRRFVRGCVLAVQLIAAPALLVLGLGTALVGSGVLAAYAAFTALRRRRLRRALRRKAQLSRDAFCVRAAAAAAAADAYSVSTTTAERRVTIVSGNSPAAATDGSSSPATMAQYYCCVTTVMLHEDDDSDSDDGTIVPEWLFAKSPVAES